MAQRKDDTGCQHQQQAGRGGAADPKFPRRDDPEHVGIGLFAGADEKLEQLRAAGGGVGGKPAGEGEFLGLAAAAGGVLQVKKLFCERTADN